MKPFSEHMNQFEEGIFQVLNEKKDQLIKEGKTVYNFSVGTPDFKPAGHIMEAVIEAAEKPENYKYALTDLPELTEAVTQRFKKRYDVVLRKEEVTSVYGSQEGISHIGLLMCDPGDVVLVPNPGYPIFEIGPMLAYADVHTYDLLEENEYLPQLDKLSEDIVKRAKFIIVSYPLNPVCKAAPQSFYEELIAWAKENEIWIIHDNAYSDIIYDGEIGRSILSYAGAKEVAVEFYSLSKSFNYTGARVGFLVGNEAVVQSFKKLRSQIDYGTFLPVQYGAIAALTGPDNEVIEQCRQYEMRRNALCDGLTQIGWEFKRSEGTMFAWAKIPEKYNRDDVNFVMELMDKTGVICTPGSSFGSLGTGYVRFALVLSVSIIKDAVEAIKASNILK